MTAAPTTSTAPPAPPALKLNPIRRLIPLEWLCILHAMEVRDALDEVEAGALSPAFNLATDPNGRKRKIHLWRGVVESYAPDRAMPKFELKQVIESVLPPLGIADPAKVVVRGSDLCDRLCCNRVRSMMLVRAGEWREVGRHDPVRESPRISRESIVRFLHRRAL
jgi:hypothetical protein